MIKPLVVFGLALMAFGCSAEGERTQEIKGATFTVLGTIDGCTTYRVRDGDAMTRYFVKCGCGDGRSALLTEEHEGKHVTQQMAPVLRGD